jgi:hypothetical protein
MNISFTPLFLMYTASLGYYGTGRWPIVATAGKVVFLPCSVLVLQQFVLVIREASVKASHLKMYMGF